MNVRSVGRRTQPAPDAGSASRFRGQWTFSERPGGVSEPPYASLNLADHVGDNAQAVAENRRILAAHAGLPFDQLAIMNAAHGNDVAEATGPGVITGVDALICRTPGLGVVALAADCVPLALVDDQAGVVAAVHSGWRGVVANVAAAAVEAMIAIGADPGRIVARIGPAICPGCYEVSEEVAMAVGEVSQQARARTRSGTPAVDVQAGVLAQLLASGVTQVSRDDRCTFEDPSQFFSYRRDGVTGRQGVVVSLGATGVAA